MIYKTLDAIEKIFERCVAQGKTKEYGGLLTYYATAQAAEAGGNKELLEKCRQYFNLYPDNIQHPNYFFEVYRPGGMGKAWMFFKGYMPESADLLREYAEIVMQARCSKDGLLCMPHRVTKREMAWIDPVHVVSPYMLYVGLALNEEKYIDYAVEKTIKAYDIFLDKECGLLHQCKGFDKRDPEIISRDHWGRGNGWGYIALTEMACYLPDDSKHKETVVKYFIDHSDAIIKQQTVYGLWRQEMMSEHSWHESSGTAIFIYGLGKGIRHGILKGEKYVEAFKKGVQGLINSCIVEDLTIYRCCHGCCCPGYGDMLGSMEAYSANPMPIPDDIHAFGPVILALTEAYKAGITELDISNSYGYPGFAWNYD